MDNCEQVHKLWEIIRNRHPKVGVEDDQHTMSQIRAGLTLFVEGKAISPEEAIQIDEWGQYVFKTPQKLREDLAVGELTLNGDKVDFSINRWPACEPPEELRDNIPIWPLNIALGIKNLVQR